MLLQSGSLEEKLKDFAGDRDGFRLDHIGLTSFSVALLSLQVL